MHNSMHNEECIRHNGGRKAIGKEQKQWNVGVLLLAERDD